MPSNMLDTDVGFPRFTGLEPTEQKIEQILNYLYMLREQLRYSLSHIGEENFSDASLAELTETITSPIDAILTDEAGSISALQQTVNSLSLTVYTDGGISHVGLTKDGVTVYATGVIDMRGLVTFTDLSGSGTTTINGDNIVTGTITGTTLLSRADDVPSWLDLDVPSVQIQDGRIALGNRLGDSGSVGTIYGELYCRKESTSPYTPYVALYGAAKLLLGTLPGGTTMIGDLTGNANADVRIYGNVYINDVLVS